MHIIDINGNDRDCIKAYPDPNYPGYLKIEYKNQVRSYTDWYPIKDFLINNPDLEHLTKNAASVTPDDLGIVTKSTKDTLTDKTKKWKIDVYTDFPVWIARGKGEGQTRKVLSNTHSTLTLNTPWDILPDTTSQYLISHNIHDPQILGNTLPLAEIDVTEVAIKKKEEGKDI